MLGSFDLEPVFSRPCLDYLIGLSQSAQLDASISALGWSQLASVWPMCKLCIGQLCSLHPPPPPPSALVKCPRKLKQGQLTTKQTRVNQTGWNEISTILREIGRGQRAKNQQQLFIRIAQSDFQVALEGSEIHVFFCVLWMEAQNLYNTWNPIQSKASGQWKWLQHDLLKIWQIWHWVP